MFEKMLKWLRRMISAFFSDGEKDTPLDISISAPMENAISRWAAEYEGHPFWASKEVKSIGLPAGIAAEVARLVTMEADIQIGGSPHADFLNAQLENFLTELPNYVELAVALGGIVFKPYAVAGRLEIDAVQADSFFPTTFDTSGRLTGGIFVDQIKRKDHIYTRLESHEFSAKTHIVRNRAFSSSNTMRLGDEIPLETVPEWADISPEVIFHDAEKPLFAYLKMPFTNRVDRHSPLGASLFSGSTEALLRDADEQYGRYIWEYEGGKLAIDAADDHLKHAEDGTVALPANRLFRGHGTRDPDFYQVFAPALRDESLRKGFHTILQRIEFNCGLAYGTLSDPQTVDKTAEEVRASKQRSYSTVKSIQTAVENAIRDLAYAMSKVSVAYNLSAPGEIEITFDWDDSIVNDPAERKKQYWQYVQSGKFPLWRYLKEFEGYTEEEARTIQAETSQAIGDPYADA